jgi:hypothetical protein
MKISDILLEFLKMESVESLTGKFIVITVEKIRITHI